VSRAYNEHLVRDVGALFLALVIASLWTARNRAFVTPVAVAAQPAFGDADSALRS